MKLDQLREALREPEIDDRDESQRCGCCLRTEIPISHSSARHRARKPHKLICEACQLDCYVIDLDDYVHIEHISEAMTYARTCERCDRPKRIARRGELIEIDSCHHCFRDVWTKPIARPKRSKKPLT